MESIINITTQQQNTIMLHTAVTPSGHCTNPLPFELSTVKPGSFMPATTRPLPGFEQYRIGTDATLYGPSGIVQQITARKHAAPQVRLRNNGKAFKRNISKLLAMAFIPNPNNYNKVIHLDRNYQNFQLENLQWASDLEFIRHTRNLDANDAILGILKKKKREPDWIDPLRVSVEDFPDYYVTPNAIVYRNAYIIKPALRKDKSPKICLRRKGQKGKYAGLARLVAEHFVPNPRNYTRVIFKDRNRQNCHYTNLAWVDNETWITYCGVLKGGKKLFFTREEAIKLSTDVYMLNYYKTLDEYWLHECWKDIEEKIILPSFKYCRSECYLYFIDRVQRFSVHKNPLGLVLNYMKIVFSRLRKEVSDHMPVKIVKENDESLRQLTNYD